MVNLEEDKKGFSILLVDDNDNNLFTLSHRLQKEGYQTIQTVASGKEALDKINSEPFDLVLLDLMMPDITGKDVLTSIKSNPKTQKIMVLMISGDDRIESAIECIKLGAEDFLQKPFNADLLRARVGACLKKKLYADQEGRYKERLEFEREQYKQLLDAIFPQKIISELTEYKSVKPCVYNNTSVIFIDIFEFTLYCSKHSPQEIFEDLQTYFSLCEQLSYKHNLEKIKTIGDAFMATAGMFIPTTNPVLNAVKFSLELLDQKHLLAANWDLHIGIDYGDVIAGVVGHSKYLFDIWGDKVNSASRIQAVGDKNAIHLSKDAFELVRDTCNGKSIGIFDLKGKGETEIFEVYSLK
jgi:adenylate cyclase